MEVHVYGPLRSATGSKRVTLTPADRTVAGLVTAFREAYPRAESHLVDCDGELRASVRVMVDGEKATPNTECPPDASVKIFPAMQGG